jgi:hypothetical protein
MKQRTRLRRLGTATAALGVLVALVAAGGVARGANHTDIGPGNATQIGTFGGVAYTQYDGIVEGETSTGSYRVPYRITAPADPAQGSHSVVVEPPHFAQGLGSLRLKFGADFLLGRGFSHAGVGYSTTVVDGRANRILDPTVPGVFINGGFDDQKGRTDDKIIIDFARALTSDAEAVSMLGPVERRYVTGFSDSSVPVLRMAESGLATGVFDLSIPFTADDRDGVDPQQLLADGRYGGKLIIVQSEYDGSRRFIDTGTSPNQYRMYVVAGTPHVPDPLVPFPLANRTTPATYKPALRAHFLQGHRWVTQGVAPVPSTHIPATGKKSDTNGNSRTVDTSGQPVARLPYVELGEARFEGGFTGKYSKVKTIAELGFASHSAYLAAFDQKLAAYEAAGYALPEDVAAMHARASLCPPLTFTAVYRDHYGDFVAKQPC